MVEIILGEFLLAIAILILGFDISKIRKKIKKMDQRIEATEKYIKDLYRINDDKLLKK